MTSQQYLHLSRTFIFPISGATAPVAGNGLNLGLTNGSATVALASEHAYNQYNYVSLTDKVGATVGSFGSSSIPYGNCGLGVTTDPTKSGMVASFSDITLGDIPSLQLGNFFIKY